MLFHTHTLELCVWGAGGKSTNIRWEQECEVMEYLYTARESDF